MAIKKISIETFLGLISTCPVFDVRSPGEYGHAHIPGVYSLPLFLDEERARVGTLYKQQGKERAIKEGLDFFGPRMRSMVEYVEKTLRQNKYESKQIIVHCWRGGMRSAGVAWLLDLYGYEVSVVVGGYKAFRRWVLNSFENKYDFKILGGYTGTGKTEIIQEIKSCDEQIIDLEQLASHRGSAFGAIGQPPQPTQEMFENKLALFLLRLDANRPCWLEDESQRIGKLNIPHALWKTIRSMPVYFVEMQAERRLEYIIEHYGMFSKEQLGAAIERIRQKLGGLETKNALLFLEEGNIRECFRILLAYYDKLYLKSLGQREELSSLLHKIEVKDEGLKEIAKKLIESR